MVVGEFANVTAKPDWIASLDGGDGRLLHGFDSRVDVLDGQDLGIIATRIPNVAQPIDGEEEIGFVSWVIDQRDLFDRVEVRSILLEKVLWLHIQALNLTLLVLVLPRKGFIWLRRSSIQDDHNFVHFLHHDILSLSADLIGLAFCCLNGTAGRSQSSDGLALERPQRKGIFSELASQHGVDLAGIRGIVSLWIDRRWNDAVLEDKVGYHGELAPIIDWISFKISIHPRINRLIIEFQRLFQKVIALLKLVIEMEIGLAQLELAPNKVQSLDNLVTNDIASRENPASARRLLIGHWVRVVINGRIEEVDISNLSLTSMKSLRSIGIVESQACKTGNWVCFDLLVPSLERGDS